MKAIDWDQPDPTRWCEPPKSPQHKAEQDALIPSTASRVWAWKPEWYWHGWSTLSPIHFGMMYGDEYGRKTIMLGWTVTGRVIIALKTCYCWQCDAGREQTKQWREESP